MDLSLLEPVVKTRAVHADADIFEMFDERIIRRLNLGPSIFELLVHLVQRLRLSRRQPA